MGYKIMINQLSIKIWLPVIVISLAIFAFLVYSGWMKTINAFEVSQFQLSPNEKPASQIPFDWKTYRSERYGIEFRYPPTSEIIDQSFFQNPSDFQIDIDYDARGGFEPPRLTISNRLDPRPRIKAHNTSTFLKSNINEFGENSIRFSLNSKDVYANCLYFGDSEFDRLLLDFCNRVLSTFRFIE